MPTLEISTRNTTVGPTFQDIKKLSDKVDKALAAMADNEVQLTSDSQGELDSRIVKLEQGLTDLTTVPAKVAALEKKAAAQTTLTKITALEKKVSSLETKLKKLSLSQLVDIDLTGAKDNAVLSYQLSSKKWTPMNEE